MLHIAWYWYSVFVVCLSWKSRANLVGNPVFIKEEISYLANFCACRLYEIGPSSDTAYTLNCSVLCFDQSDAFHSRFVPMFVSVEGSQGAKQWLLHDSDKVKNRVMNSVKYVSWFKECLKGFCKSLFFLDVVNRSFDKKASQNQKMLGKHSNFFF